MKLRSELAQVAGMAALVSLSVCGGSAVLDTAEQQGAEQEPPEKPYDHCEDYSEVDSCCADQGCAWFRVYPAPPEAAPGHEFCLRRDFVCMHKNEPIHDCPEGYRCDEGFAPTTEMTDCYFKGELIIAPRGLCTWDP